VYYYLCTDPHDAQRCGNGLSDHLKALISRGIEPVPPKDELQNFSRNRQKSFLQACVFDCLCLKFGPAHCAPIGRVRGPGRPRKALPRTALV